MEQFNRLLLKTAFACMICDGDIAEEEISLIKQLHREQNLFGSVNIEQELKDLSESVQHNTSAFFKAYFDELNGNERSNEEDLQIVDVAIATIKADNIIEYSEIKFFKLIRSMLQVDTELIAKRHPDFEDHLEPTIFSETYLARFFEDFSENMLGSLDFKEILSSESKSV